MPRPHDERHGQGRRTGARAATTPGDDQPQGRIWMMPKLSSAIAPPARRPRRGRGAGTGFDDRVRQHAPPEQVGGEAEQRERQERPAPAADVDDEAPSEGPAATPRAVIEPHRATVAVRWPTGVEASSSPSDAGVTRAPPTPCPILAAIINPGLGAAPTSDRGHRRTRPGRR